MKELFFTTEDTEYTEVMEGMYIELIQISHLTDSK